MFCSRSELKARYLLLNTGATSKHKKHVLHLFFLFYLQLFSTFICNCIPLLIAIVFLFYLQLFSSFICNYFSLTKLQFWAKYLTWHDVSLGCPESEDGEDPSCPPPPHHSFLGKKNLQLKGWEATYKECRSLTLISTLIVSSHCMYIVVYSFHKHIFPGWQIWPLKFLHFVVIADKRYTILSFFRR